MTPSLSGGELPASLHHPYLSQYFSPVYDSITGDLPGAGDFGQRDISNLLRPTKDARTTQLQLYLALDLALINFVKAFDLSTDFKSRRPIVDNLPVAHRLLQSAQFDPQFDDLIRDVLAQSV